MSFNSLNSQLDYLLTQICIKVQVSKTEHERAQRSYGHVADWLAESPSTSILYHSNPVIYPQGSLRIGTPTKPIAKNEFDVDLVCEFQLPWSKLIPQTLLEATFSRLQENEIFKRMLPEKLVPGRRCVTLTYKNEFHIDVLPACPATVGDTAGHIKVADKFQHGLWKDSNPKGYAKWFDQKSNSYPQEFRDELRKALVIEFPDHEEFDVKTPLQRSVQLLKRWRDVAFEGVANPASRPISVVITTLAAAKYSGETSINEAVRALLSDLNMKVSTGQKIKVPNPANPGEDFAEQWEKNPAARAGFVTWVQDTYKKWEELNLARGPKLAKLLSEMFGEEVAESAIRSQVEKLQKSRATDQLGINTSTGSLTFGAAVLPMTVKKNTFFGS